MTHKLAYNISLFLCRKDTIDEEDIDIYTYGFEVLMDSVLETALLLVLGLVIGRIVETLVFICAFGVLRSFTGGYHASSKIVCTFMTSSTCVINIAFSCIMSKYTSLTLVLGLIGVVVIWICAPKAHANKPLSDQQRIRNRAISRMLCVIYIIGILIFWKRATNICNVMCITFFQISVLLLGKEDNLYEEGT